MSSATNFQQDAHYRKMTEWPVSKLVTVLGIPTTISMLVTNIYNMADTYFVGTLDSAGSNSASGAVGIVFGLMAIIQAFGFMFGHGAGSIVARRLGEKDAKSATLHASVSFFTSLLTGAVLAILGLLFINPFMKLLGSTDTILPYARAYGIYILISAPIMMASFVLNNILRYEGKAFWAMIGLTTGGLLNIFGDALFILILDMGIAGAGLATALSQFVSFLILLSMFLRGKTQSKLSLSAAKENPRALVSIIKTGLPSLMRQGLSSVSTMVLNRIAGAYGDTAIAAMSIVNRISFFIFAVGLGIGQGFQPVAAFNYGAKKYTRVRKAFLFTLFAGEALLGSFAIVAFFFSSGLVGIFRPDPNVIEIGTLALRFQLFALFFHPLTICATMLFQSIGANTLASFFSILRSGLIFIPLILILYYCLGLLGIQMAQALADILTFFVTLPVVIQFLRNLPPEEPSV